jgi:hypothetical protein
MGSRRAPLPVLRHRHLIVPVALYGAFEAFFRPASAG